MMEKVIIFIKNVHFDSYIGRQLKRKKNYLSHKLLSALFKALFTLLFSLLEHHFFLLILKFILLIQFLFYLLIYSA